MLVVKKKKNTKNLLNTLVFFVISGYIIQLIHLEADSANLILF